MQFELEATDSQTKARAGIIHTDHGKIETPVFMPVGTQGTVKAVDQTTLRNTVKAPIILGNTYHLFLRPGMDVMKQAGGLHKFMSWEGSILTDSGGYQVYSISDQRKIKEEGVIFRSHIDGSKHLFSPENVVDTQRIIGADIIMAFDECTPYPCEVKYAENSMHMTHRWLDRCMAQMKETQPLYGHQQALFPIVQGSVYPNLRKQSAEYVLNHEAYGYAIGGLSVGEPIEDMYSMTDLVTDILPENKPRYLMGVGTPANILESISRGIDMLDCVMPTRNARNGQIFTTQGIINLKNARWSHNFSQVDPVITTKYSLAYLRHLTMANEHLAAQIASTQNLSFYLWLVKEARKHILLGDFEKWKEAQLPIISRKL